MQIKIIKNTFHLGSRRSTLDQMGKSIRSSLIYQLQENIIKMQFFSLVFENVQQWAIIQMVGYCNKKLIKKCKQIIIITCYLIMISIKLIIYFNIFILIIKTSRMELKKEFKIKQPNYFFDNFKEALQFNLNNMNNFHYKAAPNNLKNERNVKLLQQLQMIDRQIQQGNKKLADKKKLQEQFYEDNNKMNLADQIMNQLLYQKAQPKKNNLNEVNLNKKQIQNPIRYSSPDHDFHQQKIVFKHQNIERSPIKKNQFINPREVQKLKLQKKNAQQQFPFGINSRQKDRRHKYQELVKISPERQYQNKDIYSGLNQKPKPVEKQSVKQSNPFLKNQQYLKQKREQQQRRYRKLLQQQMQQQKRRKQSQKQKYKQELQHKFNNYTPVTANIPTTINDNKSPTNDNVFKKKRDPNAQYISAGKPTGQIRQSDFEYMKLQLQDLKNKYKKGRINHQEYEQQIKKLEIHYKFKIQDIEAGEKYKEQVNQVKEQPIKYAQQEKYSYAEPAIKNSSERLKQNFQQGQRRQAKNSLNTPSIQAYVNPLNTSVPLEYIQRQQQLFPNYSNFQQPTINNYPNPNQADYQMQFMFKLLQQFRNIYKMQTQTMINQKRVLQDTLTKMIPNVNPHMMTQQMPVSQIPPPQKQFFTDVKKIQKYDNFPKNNIQGIQNSIPQSESEITSSYIQKSLSGIVNKIPLTKKQKQEDKGDSNKDLIKFYQRKYKIKKFKGFQYKQADNQSDLIIPSVSNFLQTKQSHNELNQAFERDLRNYKKLQKQRDMQVMMQKIKKSKQTGNTNQQKKVEKKIVGTKNLKNLPAQSKNLQKVEENIPAQKFKQKPTTINPFLKKHISNQSNQSNHSQNETFNKQKQLSKIIQNFNSPVQKSSQILQQEQYQTEPRKVDSPTSKNSNFIKNNKPPIIPNSSLSISSLQFQTYNKEYPSSKIMNIMKANNQVLAKYEMTPPNYSQAGSNYISSIKQMVRGDISKDISSRQYFSGYQISPVQKRQYESSLQTVRSEEESGKFDRKNNIQLLMGSAQRSIISNNFRSPTTAYVPVQASPTIESIQQSKQINLSNNQRQLFQQNNFNFGYSQTVQSLQESQGKLISFQKPPNNNRKGGRSVSRKKQSVVKIGSSDNFQKSGLSGIPSQGSKQKSSLGKYRQQEQSLGNVSNPKFDSNVYQSGYEESVAIRTRNSNQKQKQNSSRMNQKSSIPKTQKQSFVKQTQTSNQSKKLQQPATTLAYPTASIPAIQNISTWKSLEQARKIAKQYKIKAGQENNRSSVQEKLSQLQSFIQTNKKQQSVIQQKKRDVQKQSDKKKDNISKLLDDLGEDEQDYQADFDSYKQESEMK